MKSEKLRCIIEALIMTSGQPISIKKILALIADKNIILSDIQTALVELGNHYKNRGIELKEVASGYRFQACETYSQWFHRLLDEKPPKYSKALLETLAIIAYRQPVTRADVEAVRGVAVSSAMMKTLQEREWIRIIGQRDVPGKPSIYATTKTFLDYFGLCALSELPPLSEIKDLSSLMHKGDEAFSDSETTLQAYTVKDINVLNNLTTQSVDASDFSHQDDDKANTK